MHENLDFEWRTDEFLLFCRSTQLRPKTMRSCEQALQFTLCFFKVLKFVIQIPKIGNIIIKNERGLSMGQQKKSIPLVESRLRHHILEMPKEIRQASGIVIYGRRIKSLVFTTDLAIIKNCDADAVFAVYPFTPQQSISDAIIKASYIPVFCGVGGGTTKGLRTISLAKDVESQGAMGVVLNAPINNLNLMGVVNAVDIPVIITVADEKTDIGARIEAGASILNVAAAAKTPQLVRSIREQYPNVPIIATGGNRPETITATIEAGANAITYTPPTAQELFKTMMSKYREE